MAENENVGGVKVTIGGDYSPLVQAFGQAQGVAQQAGAAVASAFNSGAQSAPTILDQFGRSASVAAPQVNQLTTEIDRLIQAIREEGAASDLAMQRNIAMTRSLGGIGQGAQSATFSMRYLFLGLKDIAEGRTTFALAEAANELTRLGPAAIGAGAALAAIGGTAYGISKLADYIASAGSSTEEARKNAEKFDETIRRLASDIERLQQARFQTIYGNTAAEAKKATDETNNLVNGVDRATLAMTNFQIAQQQALGPGLAAKLKGFGANLLLGPFGSGAGPAVEGAAQTQKLAELNRDLDVAQVNQEKHKQDAANETLKLLEEQQAASRKAEEEAGRLAATKIQNEIAATTRQADFQRDAAEAAIKAAKTRADAVAEQEKRGPFLAIQLAQNEVTAAQQRETRLTAIATNEANAHIEQINRKAAAEERGKNANERADIEARTQGEVAAEQGKAQRASLDAYAQYQQALEDADKVRAKEAAKVWEEWKQAGVKAFDELGKTYERFDEEHNRIFEEQIKRQARVLEIQDKSSGEVAALQIERQKIAIENQYGASKIHTLAETRAYLEQIAALEKQENDQKIAGLELEKATAEAIGDQVRAAQAQAQIDIARQRGINQQAQIQGQIQHATLGNQVSNDIRGGLNGVADAVARGVVNGGHGLGRDITGALKQGAQSILGDIFKNAVQHLASTILANTAAQAILHAIFGTSIGVQAANTAAVATNATASATLAVVNTSLIVSNTVLTAAVTELATVMTASLFLGGFADGGSPPVGVPSIVGERGPEIFVPKEAGTVIPNHMIKGYADGGGFNLLNASTTNSGDTYNLYGGLHAHGVHNADQMVREIPRVLKARTSKGAPYSS